MKCLILLCSFIIIDTYKINVRVKKDILTDLKNIENKEDLWNLLTQSNKTKNEESPVENYDYDYGNFNSNEYLNDSMETTETTLSATTNSVNSNTGSNSFMSTPNTETMLVSLTSTTLKPVTTIITDETETPISDTYSDNKSTTPSIKVTIPVTETSPFTLPTTVSKPPTTNTLPTTAAKTSTPTLLTTVAQLTTTALPTTTTKTTTPTLPTTITKPTNTALPTTTTKMTSTLPTTITKPTSTTLPTTTTKTTTSTLPTTTAKPTNTALPTTTTKTTSTLPTTTAKLTSTALPTTTTKTTTSTLPITTGKPPPPVTLPTTAAKTPTSTLPTTIKKPKNTALPTTTTKTTTSTLPTTTAKPTNPTLPTTTSKPPKTNTLPTTAAKISTPTLPTTIAKPKNTAIPTTTTKTTTSTLPPTTEKPPPPVTLTAKAVKPTTIKPSTTSAKPPATVALTAMAVKPTTIKPSTTTAKITNTRLKTTTVKKTTSTLPTTTAKPIKITTPTKRKTATLKTTVTPTTTTAKKPTSTMTTTKPTKPTPTKTDRKPEIKQTKSTTTAKPATTKIPTITTIKPTSTTTNKVPLSVFNPLLKEKFFTIPDDDKIQVKSTTSVNNFKSVDNRKVDRPEYIEILGHLFPICNSFDHAKGAPGHQQCAIRTQNNLVQLIPIDGKNPGKKTIFDLGKVEEGYGNFDPKKFFTVPDEEKPKIVENTPPFIAQFKPVDIRGKHWNVQNSNNFEVKTQRPDMPKHYILVQNNNKNTPQNGYFLINRPTYPFIQIPIQVTRTSDSYNERNSQNPVYFKLQRPELGVNLKVDINAQPKMVIYGQLHQHKQTESGRGVVRRTKRSTDTDEDGVSLALVFDTSGSMSTELHLVKESALRITNEMLTNPNIAIHDFIFVPFQDQQKPADPTKTRDREVFFDAINSVQIRGGYDCPEKSLGGLLKAIQLSKYNSFIYVFTDAYAKDYYLVPEIIALTQRKHPQIFFLLTGYCYDFPYPEEQVNAYMTIASVSSGLIMDLTHKTDVDEVLNYIPGNSKKGKVLLKSVNSENGAKNPYVIPLNVDPTIKEMTISTTGSNVSVTVLNPSGIYPDPKQIQELLHLDNINVFCVQQPEPGVWTINVTQANTRHSIVTTGLSSNTFQYGFSIIPTYEIKETSKRPQKGAKNYLLIKATSPDLIEKITHVSLVNLDGEILGHVPINEINTQDGIYIGGPFIPPDQLFKIEINGETKDGFPLKRVTITAISPQLPEKPFISFEPNLITKSGDAFNISCNVESLVPMSIKLIKKPSQLLISKSYSQTSEINFSINEISQNDEGIYTCWAQNIAGISSQDMNLKVEENPPEVYIEKETNGFLGESLTVLCKIKSATPYKTFWSKLSNSSHIETPLMSETEKTRDIINFEYLTVQDEGIYTCTAKNNGGEKSAKIYIKVVEKPKIEISKDEFYFKSESLLSIECSFYKGLPKPDLTWHKNNQMLKTSERINVQMEGNTLKLEIYNLRISDQGIYTCIGSNSVGIDTKEVKIYHGQPPIVTIKSYKKLVQSLAGEDITIQCKVSGIPKPYIEWRKNPDYKPIEKNSSGVLKIISPSVEDSGEYLCIAKNTIGEAEDSINILFGTKPKIIDLIKDINLEIDENANVYCLTEGEPMPTVTWRRLDGKSINRYIDQNSIRINKANLNDGGVYVCRAQNYFGIDERQIIISITGATPPIISKDSQNEIVKYLNGQRVELDCKVQQGKPKPTIRWEQNGRNINTKYFYGYIANNGSLIFNSLNSIIVGNYSCIAENAVGHDMKNITLQNYEPPKIDARSLSNIVANVGNPVVLQCEVTGDPKPSISWSRESQFNSIIRGYRKENSTFLYFDEVKVEDSGRYTCSAKNLAGEVKKEVYLHVFVPPKVQQWMAETSVELGKIFSLRCNATGIPKPNVKWLKDNLPFKKANSIFGRDVWFSAELSDAGTYTCLAENKAGIDRTETKLVILERPVIGYLPNEVEVVKGKQAALICKATGYPVPQIYWEFNGNIASKQLVWNGTVRLNIAEVSDNDSGSYYCVASNAVETIKKKVILKVLEPPLITSWKTLEKAILGEEVILKCNVIANPKPTITWYLNNEFFDGSSNGTIRFFVDKNHSGEFTCVAKNIAGSDSKTMSFLILEPPKFPPYLPDSMIALAGTNMTLSCTAFGDPKPEIYWDENNINEYRKIFSPENGTLTISNITVDDEGIYVCNAKNKAGISRYNIELIVLETPKVRILTKGVQNGEINENEDLVLTCKIQGKPEPKITWVKDNRIIMSPNNNILKLKATEEETGNFTCLATNSVGSDNATVHINVKARPKFEEPEDENLVFIENTDAVLSCRVRGTPLPKITWRKNGILVQGHFISEVNGLSQIYLQNLTQEMSGNYTCTAVNILGTNEKYYYVAVHSLPAIEDDFPTNLTINEGEDYSIPCTVKGYPKPEVKWKIGPNFIPKKISSDSYIVLGDNTLVLTNVSTNSSGEYQCIASNLQGSKSKMYKITVLAPVTIVQEGMELIEKLDGDSAKLYCTGEPGTEITWFKNGIDLKKHKARSDVEQHEIKDNGTRLNFEEVYSSSIGNYTCIMKNRGKNITKNFFLNVLSRPYLFNEYLENEYKLKFGDSLEINCSMGGNPTPVITWRYDNLPITNLTLPGVKIYQGTLKIGKINYAHNGIYKCQGANKVGKLKKIFNIKVTGSPKIIGNDSEHKEIVVNQSLEMHCDIEGIPKPNYSWFFNTSLVNNKTPWNNITNVQSYHKGTYYCEASNEYGFAKKTFIVNIIVPSNTMRISSRRYTKSESSDFQLNHLK